MGKELVISSNRHETKVAVLENDQLVEVFFQRSNEYSLAGSIQKGRVTRVLPGMQSAFVDIGLERDAFLYVTDFFEEQEEYDKMSVSSEDRPQRQEVQAARVPSIAVEPGEAAAVAPPASSAPDEGGERRNRRSRRRRNRGRGFPESKYAPVAAAPETMPEPLPEPEAQTPPEAGPGDEYLILPGESLAKYRGGAQEPVEVSAPTDEYGPCAGLEAPVESDAQAISDAVAEAEPETQETKPAEAGSFEVELASTQADLPMLEAETAEPDAPLSCREPETSAAAGTTEEEPEVEQPPEDEPQVVEEFQPAADQENDSGVEQLAETLGDAEETPVEEVTAAPAEGAGDGTAGLQAGVREPAARYPHRISRRMRRKIRGTAASERQAARQDQEPRADVEQIVAPAERSAPSISDLLKEGQEILVQIAKEPLGQKGARITSHIALPGRYVVYMPTVDHPGVSRKIASEEERFRLRKIIQTHRTGMPGGFIVRTAGEGKSEREIAADMTFLYNLWLDIRQKAEKRPAPAMIHHDLDIVQRLLRDQLADSFKAVWVDSEEVYESVLRFVERLQPALVPRVKLYTRRVPIFDAFNITSELEKALRPKVWLKSGGYIVVNQTEALVAIDVNTGKFVGKSNRLEDTIVKTNVEAVREIVRQMRLRDLGGIIVVDFIDMDERKNRQKVMQALEDEMRSDRAPYKILQFNDFGLVAITRKRVKQSLERTLCSPCPYCEGAGYVKSVQTVVGEILQEAQKIAGAVEGPNVVLRANPEVAKLFKSAHNDYLEELEEILRRPVLVTGDPLLHPEKWDLA
jgi:ribonuclease G